MTHSTARRLFPLFHPDRLAAALVLLAVAVRWPWLSVQSIAFDESFSLAVSRANWPVLFQAVLSDGVHPPLYYVLHKGTLALFGLPEFGQRFDAAVFSVLAVALVYRAGRIFAGSRAGLAAALLLALNPVHVWLSQEARMYSLLIALTITAMTFFWQAVERGRRRDWAGLAAVHAVIFTLHYFGFLVPTVQFLFLLTTFRRNHRRLRMWAFAQAVAFLPLLPWLVATARREAQTFGIGFLVRPDIVDLPVTFWNLLVGASTRLGTVSLLLGVLVGGFFLFALRPPTGTGRARRVWLLLTLWAAAPPVITWLVSQRRSFYADRYLSFTIPALVLLLAGAWLRVDIRWRKPVLVALTAATALGLVAVRLDPAFHKDDWRGAAACIDRQARRGDVILLYSTHIKLVFDYYHRGPVPVRPISLNLQQFEIDPLTADAVRAWVVYPYTRRPTHYPLQPLMPNGYWHTDPQRNPLLVDWFDRHRQGVVDYRHFRGVEVWLVEVRNP
ncbi:MAG: phospholipid carrier-dependent glycosyltransferase [Chloroflexi bacterium]|nr:MAG: phospholipid carrier-dependent glycosyltransferase [Chloroflexota bacterium]